VAQHRDAVLLLRERPRRDLDHELERTGELGHSGRGRHAMLLDPVRLGVGDALAFDDHAVLHEVPSQLALEISDDLRPVHARPALEVLDRDHGAVRGRRRLLHHDLPDAHRAAGLRVLEVGARELDHVAHAALNGLDAETVGAPERRDLARSESPAHLASRAPERVLAVHREEGAQLLS
jgi:hypothetical protein